MNEVERLVADVWRRALRIAEVGIDETFVALGGNSLIAMSVVRDLQRETGLALPAALLFECPTVRTLARRLAGLQANAATSMRRTDAPVAPPSTERDIAIVAITEAEQELVFRVCAWEAMERAGYDAERFAGRVGIFAASASHRLDRLGLNVAVETHCSTSAAAAHRACQSLLAGECDLALVGGVSVRAPDRAARGTLLGDGCGVVVLKRLREAVADGDAICAVIKNSPVNDDARPVVLEEPPALQPSSLARPVQLLPLSAETSTDLAMVERRLATYLREHADVPLADVAFTLQVGRRRFAYRRAVVCRDHAEAIASLENGGSGAPPPHARPAAVAFIYPGQGEHSAGMAATLYAREPTFRAAVDRSVAVVRTVSGVDLRPVLCNPRSRAGGDLRALLAGGAATLPAMQSQTATFIVEYALTELLAAWGIAPQAVFGSSLGEYAAACAAGVWTLEDALRIVTWRAAAIAELPGGVMLAVPLDAANTAPLLPPEVTVAIVAGPQLTVVAGPAPAVEDVERSLAERSLVSRRLPTTHALHTAMMTPMRAALETFLAEVPMRAPRTPYVSGLTGTWATDVVATPVYWGRHLCEPVKLAAGIETLRQEPERVWLEVGPGQSLTGLLKQHAGADPRTVRAVATMPSPLDSRTDDEVLADAVGQLWLSGAAIDWAGYHAGERRRRVLLPTDPFERQHQGLPAQQRAHAPAAADANR